MAPSRATVQLGNRTPVSLLQSSFAACQAPSTGTCVVTEHQLHGVGPPQVQSFPLPFVVLHEAPACLFLKPIQVPLNGNTIIRSVNFPCCITYKILHLALLICY